VGQLSESILAATRIAGGGARRRQVKDNDHRCREANIARGGGEGDHRWREALTGGGEGITVGEDQSQVDWSDCRWREAIADGGERLQVERNDHRWREAITGGGDLNLSIRNIVVKS
jgi:hypothetical protein